MSLFDEATHAILMKFLDRKSKEAEQEIAKKGVLSEEHAIPLILKSQFNHIAHLDTELTAFREQVDGRFGQMDQRFERVDKRLDQVDQRLDRVEQRLDQVDKRFEQVDQRFDKVDKRFERLEHNLFAGFAFLGSLITIFHFIH